MNTSPLSATNRLARALPLSSVGAAMLFDVVLGVGLGWSAILPAFLLFGAAAAAVSVSDLRSRRIPNRVVAVTWIGGAVLLAAAACADGAIWPLARAGIASVALAAFYLALGLAVRGGMGMGDVKWAAVVGLYLGWLGWSAVFVGTLAAFFAAALFVVGRLVARRAGGVVPMAPFMSLGVLVAVLALR